MIILPNFIKFLSQGLSSMHQRLWLQIWPACLKCNCGMFSIVFDHSWPGHEHFIFFNVLGCEGIRKSWEAGLFSLLPVSSTVLGLTPLPSFPWDHLLHSCRKEHIYHEWIHLFKMHPTIKSLKVCQKQSLPQKGASWSSGLTCGNNFFPEFNQNELYTFWGTYSFFILITDSYLWFVLF